MASKRPINLRCCICGRKSQTRDYLNRYDVKEINGKLWSWQVDTEKCLDTLLPETGDYGLAGSRRGFALGA